MVIFPSYVSLPEGKWLTIINLILNYDPMVINRIVSY